MRPFTYLHRTPPGTYNSPASYVAATTGLGVALPSPGHLEAASSAESFVPLEPFDVGPEPSAPGVPIPAPTLSLPNATASATYTSAVAGMHDP